MPATTATPTHNAALAAATINEAERLARLLEEVADLAELVALRASPTLPRVQRTRARKGPIGCGSLTWAQR